MTDPAYALGPPHPRASAANLRAWAGLAGVLAVRNFRARFMRMRLGLVWIVVQPSVQAVVLALVFVKVFGVRGVDNYPLYVMSGVMAWQCFQQSTLQSLTASVDNGNLVKKVPVPTAIFPVAAVGTAVMVYGVQSLVLLVMAIGFGTLGPQVLLLPVALFLQCGLALGIGLCVGAFLPALRDLRLAADSALLLLFYASPILYDPSRLPAGVRDVVLLNPMAGPLQLHRAALLERPVDAGPVALSVVVALVLLALGSVVYRRRSRVFADLV